MQLGFNEADTQVKFDIDLLHLRSKYLYTERYWLEGNLIKRVQLNYGGSGGFLSEFNQAN